MIKKIGLFFTVITFAFGLLSASPIVEYFSISDAYAQNTAASDAGGYSPESVADMKFFGFSQFAEDKVYECSECNIIAPLFIAVSQLTYVIYTFFTPYLLILIALFFGYWMLWIMWGKLKIDGEPIANFDFMKDVMKRVLKIGAVFVALSLSPQVFMRWTVGPMMDMASFASNKFIDISRMATGDKSTVQYEDTKYKLIGEAAEKQAFPDSMREDMSKQS